MDFTLSVVLTLPVIGSREVAYTQAVGMQGPEARDCAKICNRQGPCCVLLFEQHREWIYTTRWGAMPVTYASVMTILLAAVPLTAAWAGSNDQATGHRAPRIVELVRDDWGVPHLFAEREEDSIPGLANHGTSADYLARLAPRPILLTRGLWEWGTDNDEDREFSRRHVAETEEMVAYARKTYQGSGADAHLRVSGSIVISRLKLRVLSGLGCGNGSRWLLRGGR
jgi:hypothetical protein